MENPKVINILLGSECNMNCSHCLAKTLITKNKFKCTANDLCDELFDFITETYKRNGNKLAMSFGGGEPLIYFTTIKNIVKTLTANDIFPSYFLITNGLLLDEEKAQWLSDNDINVTLSYDFPNPTAYRDKIPTESNLKAFDSISSDKCVNTVFAPKNLDLAAASDALKKKFPNVSWFIGLFAIKYNLDESLDEYDEAEVYKSMRTYLKTEEGHRRYFHHPNHITMFNKEEWKRLLPKCSNSLVVDVEGNCYACTTTGYPLGHIREGYEAIRQKAKQYMLQNIPSGCDECEYLGMCRIGCPLQKLTEDRKEYVSCRFRKAYYKAILDHYEETEEEETECID